MSRLAKLERKGSGEIGATVVEAAIAGVLFFFVVVVFFQLALLARTTLSASQGVKAAARAGAVAAENPDADTDALTAVRTASSGVSPDAFRQVVIYKAEQPGEPVPGGCLTSSQQGVCNRYTDSDLRSLGGGFTPGTAWPAAGRTVSPPSGTAYLGVNVVVECRCSFVIPFPSQISRSAVIKIES